MKDCVHEPFHLVPNTHGVSKGGRGPLWRGSARGEQPLAPPMTPRLTAGFWVQAYLTRLRLADIPAFVVRKGDETAGAVMIKQSPLDGTATLFQREFDLMADSRRWVQVMRDTERAVDDRLARERARDPDLWVIEIEDRAGRTLLEQPGLDG